MASELVVLYPLSQINNLDPSLDVPYIRPKCDQTYPHGVDGCLCLGKRLEGLLDFELCFIETVDGLVEATVGVNEHPKEEDKGEKSNMRKVVGNLFHDSPSLKCIA